METSKLMAKEENRKSFTPKILPFLWYIYVLQKRELIYISFKEIMHIAMYMEVKLIELGRLIWVAWVKCFLKHWYLFSTSCVENCSGLPDKHFGVGFLLQLFSFEW